MYIQNLDKGDNIETEPTAIAGSIKSQYGRCMNLLTHFPPCQIEYKVSPPDHFLHLRSPMVYSTLKLIVNWEEHMILCTGFAF